MKRYLYVISDLHLGGEAPTPDHAGFQICPSNARRRLGRFIHSLRHAHKDGITELVINGDFVDFLAEKPFQSFTATPALAITKLQQIMHSTDDGAQGDERVFPALRAFVQQGHALTLMLGNHDIELSLPEVRDTLVAYLTDGQPARLTFLYDGEALRRGLVLIEHGNRYDAWNVVNHGGVACVSLSAVAFANVGV